MGPFGAALIWREREKKNTSTCTNVMYKVITNYKLQTNVMVRERFVTC